jgi:methylphosphotriester-DNA--protein-cysteine methyltransferase
MARKRIPSQVDLVLQDPPFTSLVSRDRKAGGTFFYPAATTGVYCRPFCGAGTPRPENLQLYATAGKAEEAGLRACTRCKPKSAGVHKSGRIQGYMPVEVRGKCRRPRARQRLRAAGHRDEAPCKP